MAEISKTSKVSHSMKPVVILTVATILLLKPHRVLSEDADTPSPSTTAATNANTGSTSVCPDYCSFAPDKATKGKAPFHRWYYDISDRECKRFRWGGRGGNQNRFRKKEECEETCGSCSVNDDFLQGTPPGIQDDDANKEMTCTSPVDEGQCDPSTSTPPKPQISWHYDTEGEECTPFIFYGCGGNDNRFGSRAECDDACS